MTIRLLWPGRCAAQLAILVFAACALSKAIVPIIEMPEEIRPEIRLGVVKVVYAIQTTYQESLRGRINPEEQPGREPGKRGGAVHPQ